MRLETRTVMAVGDDVPDSMTHASGPGSMKPAE